MDHRRFISYIVGHPPRYLQNPLRCRGRASADTVVRVLENSGILRIADASLFRPRPLQSKGGAYTGHLRSFSETSTSFRTHNKDLPAWVALASKKSGQSQNSSDLEDETGVMTEADLQHKPLGFGQGKDYDTSLEDKLLEELEREKATQAAAVQKRKNNAASTKSSQPRSKKPPTVDGIKVWVGDLPKKKNIDRDLRSAFKHVPGLRDISPSVLGNEKTRDPVCKGFGYLTFDTLDHAKGFITSFQGQSVSFGKVEKKLRFSFLKANEAEVIPSEKGSLVEVGRLRIRDKDAANVVLSEANPELVSFQTVGHNVSEKKLQETVHTELYQPQVEVTENGEAIGSFSSHEDSFSDEEDLDGEGDFDSDDDDWDSDDDPEIEISVDIGDLSGESAIKAGFKGTENKDVNDTEKRIEELERRLIKKLEDAGYGAHKGKHEKETVKSRGFGTKRKGNNVAAVTHGLKKREREFMTGVLEKYGKSPSTSRP